MSSISVRALPIGSSYASAVRNIKEPTIITSRNALANKILEHVRAWYSPKDLPEIKQALNVVVKAEDDNSSAVISMMNRAKALALIIDRSEMHFKQRFIINVQNDTRLGQLRLCFGISGVTDYFDIRLSPFKSAHPVQRDIAFVLDYSPLTFLQDRKIGLYRAMLMATFSGLVPLHSNQLWMDDWNIAVTEINSLMPDPINTVRRSSSHVQMLSTFSISPKLTRTAPTRFHLKTLKPSEFCLILSDKIKALQFCESHIVYLRFKLFLKNRHFPDPMIERFKIESKEVGGKKEGVFIYSEFHRLLTQCDKGTTELFSAAIEFFKKFLAQEGEQYGIPYSELQMWIKDVEQIKIAAE